MVATVSEITKLWEKTLKRLKDKVDAHSYDYFISPCYIHEIKNGVVVLIVPNNVAKTVVPNQYADLIIETLQEFVDESFSLEVLTANELAKKSKDSVSASISTKVVKEEEKSSFFENAVVKPELTFEKFVVGEFNKEAYKAATYVADNGGTLFNPLFIYSRSGLGKTHLLHAIGNRIREKRMPNAKILYITANDFVEEYIKYVKAEKDSQSIKDFFKGVDVLLLDDVQFLAGKVKTEEMFFYVYQDLVNKGKRIIITSDREPNELKGLEDRLITRFTQGLTVKIKEPDLDTCVEILKQKLVQAGIDLNKFDDNVLIFLAEKFSRDVREIEGVVNSLTFSCLNLMDEERFTMDVAIKAVSSIKGGKNIATQLNEQKIINVVADYYNLTPSQITGKERTNQIALARHISMYLIKKHLDLPFKKIGQMFGGKDHTTVMSGINKVEKELKINEQLATAISELEARLSK